MVSLLRFPHPMNLRSVLAPCSRSREPGWLRDVPGGLTELSYIRDVACNKLDDPIRYADSLLHAHHPIQHIDEESIECLLPNQLRSLRRPFCNGRARILDLS